MKKLLLIFSAIFAVTLVFAKPTCTLTVSITSHINVSCYGGSNGSAVATPSGGTSPYSFNWQPGGKSTNLTAGTYTVTVTDFNGCTAKDSVIITQPLPVIVSVYSIHNVSCYGRNDGNDCVCACGGMAPYWYTWTNGSTVNCTSGMGTAGTYTVTAYDANGCPGTKSLTITQPSQLTATISSFFNSTCNTASNGSATVKPGGGTPPYTYLWAPNGGTSATASNLSVGSYAATVTDSNGCQTIATANIGASCGINVTTSVTPATCGKSDGSATGKITGASCFPFTYSWSNGQTSTTISNLSAGTYTITVTNAYGCVATSPAIVTNGISVTTSSYTHITCYGGKNGSITASPSGGTLPYKYSWAPSGGTNATANGLSAGTYTCVVTDKNGCVGYDTLTLIQPDTIRLSFTSTAANCSEKNGSAMVAASSGIKPYNYAWSPVGGTDSAAAALTAGIYTCNITDANGCSLKDTVTVHKSSPRLYTGGYSPTCYGGNDGTASVNYISGGISPYTYAWSPGGGTGVYIKNISAGTYTVVVTDSAGCASIADIKVSQPNPATITTTITPAACGKNNGKAIITATGALCTCSFTYLWSPSGNTNDSAINLSAGTYTCNVTSNLGCTTTAYIAIADSSGPSPSIASSTNVSCNGGNNGNAIVTVTGGTKPYTYSWVPKGGTSDTANNLIAGTYTCSVTDFAGCVGNASVAITQPSPISISTFTMPDGGSCNGSAWVHTIGGTAPYTYLWSPGGKTSDSITGLCSGNYCCMVTDKNGCVDSVCVNIKLFTGIQQQLASSIGVKVYPNPNNGKFTIQSSVVSGQSIVEIYNVLGEKIYSQYSLPNTQYQIDLSKEPSGIYFYRVTTGKGELIGNGKLIIQ